jgi:hypothetical protein
MISMGQLSGLIDWLGSQAGACRRMEINFSDCAGRLFVPAKTGTTGTVWLTTHPILAIVQKSIRIHVQRWFRTIPDASGAGMLSSRI